LNDHGYILHRSIFTVIIIVALLFTFQTALQQLTARPQKIVLAYSGGLDSHVLLHLLARYKQLFPQHTYLAVHVHHGLSANADSWVEHCANTAQALGINFVAERVNFTVENRESLEAKARSARYQAIALHLNTESVLLLGQHLDDQLETFLLQLKRGAGIKGLSAMAQQMPFPLVPGCQVCRPLLDKLQLTLIDYAQQYQLSWVEDESNADQSYDRNFLRHDIIPRLKQRWPQIASAVHRSAELCAEQQTLADEIAQADLLLIQHSMAGLKIPQLRKLSKIRRNNVIRFWLAQLEFPMPSRHHLAKLWQEVVNAGEDANPQLGWQAGQFRRYQDVLYNVAHYAELKDEIIVITAAITAAITTGITTAEICPQLITLPDNVGSLRIQLLGSDNNTAQIFHCIDGLSSSDVMNSTDNLAYCVKIPAAHQRVTIRFRGQGKCQPVGRHGSRSIKKLYQEYQVAPWLRDRVPLVYYDDKLICAVGLWICAGYQAETGLQFQLDNK
jgi:tRNA(Ile)-lysidine synthase